MNAKRRVEVFSSGCSVCQETIALVNRIACPSCDVTIQDMNNKNVANRAKDLGIRSVPAVVIDGELLSCCAGSGVDEQALRTAGLGRM